MAKAVINFKVDEHLKSEFMNACKEDERSLSLVFREFMKSYLTNRKENNTLMSENEFYEMIDEARSQRTIRLTVDERKALYEMD